MAECGTRGGYDAGCRCYACKRENARYHRERRQAIRAGGKYPPEPDLSLEPLEEAVLIALHHLPARPFSSKECGEILGVSRQAIEEMSRSAMKKIASRLRHWREEAA